LGYHFNQLHFFGHCDGLVLVPTPTPASTSSTRPHQGRHHPCRKPAGGHDEARGCYCVGLGLDPRIGKYKVVQGFYRSADRTTMGMQVYTIAHSDHRHHLGSCCWRDIRNDPPYLPQRGQTALSIKGYLFWRVAEPPQQQQQRRALLHLSLEDEEFGITKLPPPDSSEDPSSPDDYTLLLDVLYGRELLCLTAGATSNDGTPLTIWTLPVADKGLDAPWERRYSIYTSPIASKRWLFHHLAAVGGSSCGMRMHTIYRYDLATCKLTTVCKMGRTRFQGRRERRCKNLYTFDVKPYTESLVRIRITPPWK
jgi:hypothetical protein